MKTNKILPAVLLLLFLGFNISYSQSDLEIVNGFKSKQKEIEQQIKNAKTLDELNSVVAKLDELKKDYLPHKALLDNSLYPDNFDKVIQNLNLSFVTRNNDFVQIDVLTTQVGELKQQVEFLNQRNNELLAQVEDLQSRSNKDKKTIVKLQNLVAELKSSLSKRDRLVMSMVDSLMPPMLLGESSLSPEEVKKVKTEEEKNNVLENIKKSINNHMEFLDATSSKPADLESMNKQKQEFVKTWQSIGVKLVEVYGDEKTKSQQLQDIEGLFNRWESALKQEAWNSIREEFAIHDINLQKFFNGNEFSDIVTAFITDQVKNAEIQSSAESQKTYQNFADSTWYASIKSDWMPYLFDHKMFTEQQKDEIETDLGQWKSAVYPANILWVYILVGAILIGAIIFFVVRIRKPEKPLIE
jgi:hypothetical protein